MKVCIAGKNSIAVNSLLTLIDALGVDSVLACPNKNDTGVSDWQPSLIRYATEYGVDLVSLSDIYKIENLIFISLEFDRIIKPEYFKTKFLFNIHFSKLPAYKGMYTSAWPILNGESESGVTLHRIDHGIDTGELIDQISFPLTETDTARSLYFKYLEKSCQLFNRNIASILAGSIISRPQSAENSTYHSRESINYSNLTVDTNQTAAVVSRQIRAYSFREFQTPLISEIPVGHHVITSNRSTFRPGTLRLTNKNEARLATIDFDVLFWKDRSNEFISAVEASKTSAVKNLLGEGCDPNLTNKQGWSPLMISAFKGDIEMCELLIENGADPNLPNQNGTTPLMYAKDACELIGDFKLCGDLIDAGAKPEIADNFGRTVLDYARQEQQIKAIDYFGAAYEHRSL